MKTSLDSRLLLFAVLQIILSTCGSKEYDYVTSRPYNRSFMHVSGVSSNSMLSSALRRHYFAQISLTVYLSDHGLRSTMEAHS